MSRSSDRNAVSTSTARSSPSSSVNAVNPETSTKAKLRCTRTPNFPCQPTSGPIPGLRRNRMVGRGGPPTMAPWRRRGDSSTTRWCSSAAVPRASAGPPPSGWPGRRAVVVGDVALDGAPAVAQEIDSRRRAGPGRHCDVRSEESVAAFVELAAPTSGPSTASITTPPGPTRVSIPMPSTSTSGSGRGSWKPTPEARCSWPATPSPT